MTLVKICGLRSYEDAKLALDLGADALGFNFYSGSRRYITPAEAQVIVRRLPPRAWLVGVFVDASRSEVENIARQVGIDTLQFHGQEKLDFCRNWKEWRVIKALGVSAEDIDIEGIRKFANVVDHLLFDTQSDRGFGGTGIEIPETQAQLLKADGLWKNAFLAGGLNPKNVAEKRDLYQPLGVDVAGGVEVGPGIKGADLMKQFIDAAKSRSS